MAVLRLSVNPIEILILESFRFEDEGDYEYVITSILTIARASQLHFGGKTCHSTTGFSKNVRVVGTSYQTLEVFIVYHFAIERGLNPLQYK